MRALGVPTRTVTNFGSAHDTDSNLTIDKHIDEQGNGIKNMDDDSIWYVYKITCFALAVIFEVISTFLKT